MKIMRSCFLILVLISVSISAADQTMDDFTAHFLDEENLADYIEKIDNLITQGEATVFTSLDNVMGKLPKTTSKNGVIMIYSINEHPDGVTHYFTVSRPPYLATPFGVDIVALFGDRAGLPFPPKIRISNNQVFHATWSFPNDNAEQKKKEIAARRIENRKELDVIKIFGNAYIKTLNLDLKQILKERAALNKNPEKRIEFYIEKELSNVQAAGWMSYVLSLLKWDDENKNKEHRYLFEREVYARENSATVWSELKEKNSDAVEKNLDILLRVKEAGLMREYVWFYLRGSDWKIPEDLKLEKFKEWRERNIPDYKPETKASLRFN